METSNLNSKTVAVVLDIQAFEDENVIRFVKECLFKSGFPKTTMFEFVRVNDRVIYDKKESANHVKECADEVFAELIDIAPDLVIALGNNALPGTHLSKQPQGITSYKGKENLVEGLPCPVAAAVCPRGIIREPKNIHTFLGDLRVAHNILSGKDFSEKKFVQKKITDPDQIDDLLKEVEKRELVAYDTETSDILAYEALLGTMCFHTGQKNAQGIPEVWSWAKYDRLRPIYTPKVEEAFKEKWTKFFAKAKDTYDLTGFNIPFDDWIIETYTGKEFPGSTYDVSIFKWAYDVQRPNGLKDNVARFLGYADYDAKIKEHVDAVKHRRTLIIDPESEDGKDDLYCLKMFGYTPYEVKNRLRWCKPKSGDVDTALAAFLMIDLETLLHYNCLDSLFTFDLLEHLYPLCEAEGLLDIVEFRHKAQRHLWKAEQRAMLLDIPTNRKISRTLDTLITATKGRLINEVAKIEDKEFAKEFNPDSGDQVIRVLYGDTQEIPVLDREYLVRKGYDETSVYAMCEDIESLVYGDLEEFKEQILLDNVDLKSCGRLVAEEFKKYTGDYLTFPKLMDYPLGLGGLRFNPPAVTKTGKPSTSKSSLMTLMAKEDDPVLALILMYKKASKLKSTFVDGLYNKLRKDGRLSTKFNINGTECISGDSYVQTLCGLKKIENLYHKTSKLQVVWNGVSLADNSYHKIARKVTYQDKIGKEIVLKYGYNLKGTNNHPVFTRRGFVNLQDLTCDDEVLVKLGDGTFKGDAVLPTSVFFKANNKSFSEWYGMMLADGDISAEGRYRIRLCNRDKQVQDRFIGLTKELFNITARAYDKADTVEFCNKDLVLFLRDKLSFPCEEGLGSACKKVISDHMMKASPGCLEALLRGLTLDSHYLGDHNTFAYGTQSAVMQNQIQIILASLGILSYKLTCGNSMKLGLASTTLPKFVATIGFVKDAPYLKYVDALKIRRDDNSKNKPIIMEDGGAYLKVTSIKDWQGDVYDLTMPKESPPQYVANGLLVHNTGRISSGGKKSFNQQNFPKNVRGQFIADEGFVFTSFDYSAMEVRVWAAFSQDEALIESLQYEDIHLANASLIFKKPIKEITDLERQIGKMAQPYSSLIYTPSGTVSMGEINLGDTVLTPNRGSAKVIGIVDHGEQDVYKITLADKSEVLASGEHLWKVTGKYGSVATKKEELLTTTQLLERGLTMFESKHRFNEYRFDVPYPGVVEFDEQFTFVPAYLMGVLLGDGCLANTTNFSVGKGGEDVATAVIDVLDKCVNLNYVKSTNNLGVDIYRLKSTDNPHLLSKYMSKIGLRNTSSSTKFIPNEYKYSSVDKRRELLAGLLDTDGYVNQQGQVSYTSKSKQLAEDVQELARSLGARCNIRLEKSGYTSQKTGERIDCGFVYTVGICFGEYLRANLPFKHSRKKDRWISINGKVKNPQLRKRSIVNIEKVGREPVRCIQIDSPDHLYITDNLIVTHNCVFLTLYQGGAKKLALACGITLKEAQIVIDKLTEAFPDGFEWIYNQQKLAKEAPYYVYTAFGTRRSTRNVLSSDNSIVQQALRQACNMPIQGTAGELTLYEIDLMINELAKHKQFEQVTFATTVHDEIAWHNPEDMITFEEKIKNDKKIMVPKGELIDFLTEVNDRTVPYAPLDTMKFPVEFSAGRHWAGKPDVHKALSGRDIREQFRYDLLDYDKDEENEDEQLI